MADDITLTVRVRDLTRGQFDDVRRRMRGMDGDIRRLGQASDLTSERAQRLGREIQGVSGRLGQMSQTGRMARHEMTFMRRTMGLLGRDLSAARRAGELSREEFNDLRRQLDETGLGFDRLMRDVERHNAIAQRAHRAELARQREAERARRDAEREAARARREEAVAARRAEAEERRRQREAERRARQLAQLRTSLARQTARDEERARREAERFRQAAARQAEAEARRAETLLRRRQRAEAAAAAAAQRQQQAAFRRDVGRLAGAGGDDGDLAARFRGLGDAGNARLTRGLSHLSNTLSVVSGNSDRARRNIGALNNDLRVMSQVLQNAQRDGNLSRREFNALANGLRLVGDGARGLRRTSDLSRAGFRGMRREVSLLQAQLRLLGGDGTRLTRLDDRLHILQRRMRDSSRDAGSLRRGLAGIGSGGIVGMRGVTRGLTLMSRGFGTVRDGIRNASHGMKMFYLILGLLGPLAAPVGALLTTALGGAFVALGAFALRSEETVRSAFSRMKSSIGNSVREAAQPLTTSLIYGMDLVGEAARQMRGPLTEAFEATAPLVKYLAGAFTDFAARALPGITQSLRAMAPVMQGFQDAMGTLGSGIGEMFDAMTSGGGAEGLGDAWRTMGNELKILLVNLGQFINAMSQSESATALFVGVMRALSGILITVESAFKVLDSTLVPVLKKMKDFDEQLFGVEHPSGLEIIQDIFDSLGISSSESGEKVEVFSGRIDTFASKAREAASALKELNDKVQELNNKNLTMLEAKSAMEAAIDKAVEGAKKLGGVELKDIFSQDTEKGREAFELMKGIAESTGRYVEKLQEAKAPQFEINEAWARGREQLLGLSDELGISKDQLALLANQILMTPEVREILIRAMTGQASQDIVAVQDKIRNTKGRSFTMKALTQEAKDALQTLGFKIKTTKGRAVEITIPTGTSNLGAIALIQAAINGIQGRTVGVGVFLKATSWDTDANGVPDAIQARASGGLIRRARGGMIPGFPGGGTVRGPGTDTSDSILARLSNGEFVMQASAVRLYGTDFMKRVNAGLLELPGFAKGGSKKAKARAKARAKAERDARNSAVGDLTISHFGKMAGYKNDEFRTALAKPDALSDLVNSLNKWRSIIKKATHGGVERNLLRKLDSAGKALIRWEKKLSSVEKSLEKAKDKLNDLKESAKQLRESVTQGLIGEANITRAAGANDSRVTINTILSQMTASAANTKQFSSMLDQLKKRGLSKDLIAQIAEAGIEGGGMETAAAILGGGSAEIKRLNDLQKQISSSAAQAGKTAADAMYAAGIKAAQGLVDGLTKKKKSIEKAMMDIAKAMEKAIKKALKIKSPSRVMMSVGHYTAEGFALGIANNNKPKNAWESMLNNRGISSGRGAPGGYGPTSGRPVVIQLSLGGRDFGEVIIDPLRKAISHRGGNVQAALGS